MENIGFSDSNYVIIPPQSNSAIYGAPSFTGNRLLWILLVAMLDAAEHKITFHCNNKIIGVLFCLKKYKEPILSNVFLKAAV